MRNACHALVTILVLGCSHPVPVAAPPAPAPPRTVVPDVVPGERVVQSMYERYAGKWYRTLTFTQATTITPGTGSPIRQTWYAALSLPGKQRVDVEDPSRGNGSLYRADSAYSLTAGKVTVARAERNDRLILGFDVYTQPVATTTRVLRGRGFDLARVHDATWQGKPVVVVGALAGDDTTKQFWIEKERMVVVRLISRAPQPQDVRFDQYIRIGAGWLATEVVMLRSGKPYLREEYSDVHADVTLDPALFVPQTWKTARHWKPR